MDGGPVTPLNANIEETPNMGEITVAEGIAKTLEKMGVEYLFGVNGHGNWAILDAVVHRTKIKGIPGRNEDQSVQMADGYWRMRRGPPLPVVSTSVGPGNLNTIPALAGAFYESVAMLLLAGSGPTHWFDRGGVQESYRYGPEEWTQVAKPVTKKASMVVRPDTAIASLLRACRLAISGRPGPVVLQVPFDIQHAKIPDELPDPSAWLEWRPPAPDRAGLAEALNLLQRAKRPLVVVGSGIHNARAWKALQHFAELADAPVAMTSTGKGAFPETHRLSLGSIGRAGTGQANEAGRRCDLLLAFGTHFTEIDTAGWSLYDIPGKTKLVHFDIDPSELCRIYPTELPMVCDANAALEALTTGLAGAQIEHTDWHNEIAAIRKEWEKSTAALVNSNNTPMHYARICRDTGVVVSEMDPEMPVLVDTGHLLSFAPPFLRTSSRYFAHSGFFHRMGWSASAAIGASLAMGKRRTLAMIGDGSFMMGGTSLATAFEQHLPITCVVLNNGTLQVERESMVRIYGNESFCDYVDTASGKIWNPDFCKWAESMGARAIKVTEPDQYAPALRKALESGVPFVVDVDIDLNTPGYRPVWTPYPSRHEESWSPKAVLAHR
jgi:acetolactate synthase-1/2/3 large subunit